VYELRDRPLHRVLLSNVDSPWLPFCLGAWIVILLEPPAEWQWFVAPGFLGFFYARSYAARIDVDLSGIVVTNRVFRRRIPWAEIRGVWVPEPTTYNPLRALRIERRRGRLFAVDVVASIGMWPEDRRVAAHELAALAKRHGAAIEFAGTEAEVEWQLAPRVPPRDDD
jgi:hypothetical protein